MNPARDGHEGGGALPLDGRARRARRSLRLRLTDARPADCRDPFAGLRRDVRRRARARPTSSTARPSPRAVGDDAARVDAAGARRAALDQAVLPLRRATAGSTEHGADRRRPSGGPVRNRDWAPPVQRRRDLDARQVGVPLVRGLGPRLPHDRRSRCVDLDFAKEQLVLLLREWYMHPNGQLPAYEWDFGDVNPPVHAWARCCVYQIEQAQRGARRPSTSSSASFHKLLLNFTWWVNRKDRDGQATSSRAASSGSTTSASSTAARRCRPAATSSRPTARRGWRSSA